MDVLIRVLAQARQSEAAHKETLQRLNDDAAEFVRILYGEDLDRVNAALSEAQALTKSAEAAVRATALNSYSENGDKHPHAAATVKIYAVLGYDPEGAFRYCVDNLTSALRIDKRKFERVAKAAELDFVDFADEPRVTIASDLSKYL